MQVLENPKTNAGLSWEDIVSQANLGSHRSGSGLSAQCSPAPLPATLSRVCHRGLRACRLCPPLAPSGLLISPDSLFSACGALCPPLRGQGHSAVARHSSVLWKHL